MKRSSIVITGTVCLLFAITGCTHTSANDEPSTDNVASLDPSITVLMDDLQASTESEPGTRLTTTGGGIAEVPNRVSFADLSGKGPFTVYFNCQVPRGSVTLTLDSTTKTEVHCDEGTKKITGVQQIALTGGLGIDVRGEANAGIWALVAKGEA